MFGFAIRVLSYGRGILVKQRRSGRRSRLNPIGEREWTAIAMGTSMTGGTNAFRSLMHLTVSPVNATGGDISFPNSSLALQSRVVASTVAIANHSIASAKCCPGQILRSNQALYTKRGKVAPTYGRIRKRTVVD
jgi:hypothetical protein